MGFLKRLVYVVGYLPFGVYLLLRWIVTGKDGFDALAGFDHWVESDE